jgi:hypothetical protein
MRAQLVIPPAPRFGRLRLEEDGSFLFRPRGRFSLTVRFFVRVFNGQEWSSPFRITLRFGTARGR